MRATRFLNIFLSAAFVLLISSCASLSRSGVGRIKRYTVESARLPESFDGTRIAFVSDLHYPSLFSAKRLRRLTRKLSDVGADIVAFGGDYLASPQCANVLFSSFSSLKTTYGKFAVCGNHDYKIYPTLLAESKRNGVVLLADSAVYLSCGSDSIAVMGVRNSFRCDSAALAMLATQPADLFTVLLAHTPDFAQDAGAECDLVLSGHTHGGQVTFLWLYTPVKNTKYGKRFLRGLNFTDKGVPVITTNGVGTSRRRVRWCASSEIVVVTLKSVSQHL